MYGAPEETRTPKIWLLRPTRIPVPSPGQNKYSMIDEHAIMAPLYRVANTQSYVPPNYATTSRQFKPDPILVAQRRVFKPDPILVPPPGSDPGSPDFQSGAMTTSAKEAN